MSLFQHLGYFDYLFNLPLANHRNLFHDEIAQLFGTSPTTTFEDLKSEYKNIMAAHEILLFEKFKDVILNSN